MISIIKKLLTGGMARMLPHVEPATRRLHMIKSDFGTPRACGSPP